MEFLAKDLHKAMIMTSCNSISEISERILLAWVREKSLQGM